MLRILRGLLWAFSFLFNLAVAFFLAGVGVLGWASGEEVRLDLIPGVEGAALVKTLIVAGVWGLVGVTLAASRRTAARIPMLIWNLLVVSILICALTRSSYRFNGVDHFWNIFYLTVLSLLALWGSWNYLRRAPGVAKTQKR